MSFGDKANDFLAAHKPWQRAVWTLIEVCVAAIPVATLRVPPLAAAPLAAALAYLKSLAASKMVGAPVKV